ncbi:DUF881 domain-containing protein [Serinibacter salmoneus]|uniref:Uncharacterized protein YlxW (UPF0749 family) n=1 Tax=Serinibacter salmoneus TaxID=556530 RepID=A0A2A9CZ52_9MICO|nr:DUF881 domain-containing protein [Serinibacter salmoneus]PFG19683.1 uncharacterized protein YlxW (UPF0749 family) [Serinibacter salmoneus]
MSTTPDAPHAHHSHRAPRPSWTRRSHLLVALLVAGLGFALVLQVRQVAGDDLAALRQDELVRLLDEITQRNDTLEAEQAQLVLDRADLVSGANAWEVARRNAEVQGILAGTIPVSGPGIEIAILGADGVPASGWVNLIEELRIAGAEAIEVNGVRVGAASWFDDAVGGVLLDDVEISSPVTVKAIGDGQTLDVALGIPGGALATLRSYDARTQVTRADALVITSVVELSDPVFATPAPEEDAGTG